MLQECTISLVLQRGEILIFIFCFYFLLFYSLKVYDMYSKPKGLVYILNNYRFVSGRRRLGSDVDFENMSNLFEQLGYELERHENLKAKVSNMYTL